MCETCVCDVRVWGRVPEGAAGVRWGAFTSGYSMVNSVLITGLESVKVHGI